MALLGVLLLAGLARLPALLNLPIFYDESVYIERSLAFPAELGNTLADGKLIHELLLTALVWLPGDLLATSRVLSLLAGCGVVVALWGLGRMLRAPGAGLVAGLLYAIAPLAVLHDGLALPDTLLALAGCGVLAASMRLALAQNPTRRDAALAGAAVGVAALVKLPGLFLFCAPVLAVLILPESWPDRRARLPLLRMVLIAALLLPAALAPFHYGGAESHKLGGDWLAPRIESLGRGAAWTLRYLPGPLLLLPPVALYLGRAERGREWRATLWLLATALCFMGAFVVLGDRISTRYLLPAWPMLMLAAALAGSALWRRAGVARVGALAAGAAALVWGVLFAGMMARDPSGAPLAELDRWQYLESWAAGHHAAQLVADLEAQAAGGAITVVTDSQPRMVGNLAWIYLRDDARVRLTTVEYPDATLSGDLQTLALAGPTYLLADDVQLAGYGLEARVEGLQLHATFQNPYSATRFLIYRVIP
jgi:Dolichyl-phosphate-mannose-protein mannosyltransferase